MGSSNELWIWQILTFQHSMLKGPQTCEIGIMWNNHARFRFGSSYSSAQAALIKGKRRLEVNCVY